MRPCVRNGDLPTFFTHLYCWSQLMSRQKSTGYKTLGWWYVSVWHETLAIRHLSLSLCARSSNKDRYAVHEEWTCTRSRWIRLRLLKSNLELFLVSLESPFLDDDVSLCCPAFSRKRYFSEITLLTHPHLIFRLRSMMIGLSRAVVPYCEKRRPITGDQRSRREDAGSDRFSHERPPRGSWQVLQGRSCTFTRTILVHSPNWSAAARLFYLRGWEGGTDEGTSGQTDIRRSGRARVYSRDHVPGTGSWQAGWQRTTRSDRERGANSPPSSRVFFFPRNFLIFSIPAFC